ncbi:MAG: hypothetical protein IT249_00040 [Chitinophagaceae bacterium]|nr:hypothetical protein [Chitinophagaceae bacterium]
MFRKTVIKMYFRDAKPVAVFFLKAIPGGNNENQNQTTTTRKAKDQYFLPNGNITAMSANSKVYHKAP